MTNHEVTLDGCRPVPIAHYLKALAVLRLVSEQKDPNARGWWADDRFVLRSTLDREALLDFFAREYAPTPMVDPWNSGSGFFEKKPEKAVESLIGESGAPRFDVFRATIRSSRQVMDRLDIDKTSAKDRKEEFLTACRGAWPEDALDWFDAAVVLTTEQPRYAPLLGTGGNDGRLDFCYNFLQRIVESFEPDSGEPRAGVGVALEGALFGAPVDGLVSAPIGQFHPGDAGGANSGEGYSGRATVNPWDFVLGLEGALLFAAATSKQLESSHGMSMSLPFAVRQTTVGYGSASQADDDHNRPFEMWLPIWKQPTRLAELRAMMSEGRAEVSGRSARNGLDFARAVGSLGVDRGIGAFYRYGFQVRNGLAYFATPLGRVEVQRQVEVDLLNQIDRWFGRFAGRARHEHAPASAGRALRNLERAMMNLATSDDGKAVQQVLLALGACEQAMAQSFAWTSEKKLRPVPTLDRRWLEAANDHTCEFRLAAALASTRYPANPHWVSMRTHLEPVRATSRGFRFTDQVSRDVVGKGSLVRVLHQVLGRRLIAVSQSDVESFRDSCTQPAFLADIARFVRGDVDDARIEKLWWALSLLKWDEIDFNPLQGPSGTPVDAAYGLLKLCFSGGPIRDVEVPSSGNIAHSATSGDSRALRIAERRLRASGLVPAVSSVYASAEHVRRAAAAILFPLAGRGVNTLANRLLSTVSTDESARPQSN